MVRQKQFRVSRFLQSPVEKAHAVFFTRLALLGERFSVALAGFGPRFATNESAAVTLHKAEAVAIRQNAADLAASGGAA